MSASSFNPSCGCRRRVAVRRLWSPGNEAPKMTAVVAHPARRSSIYRWKSNRDMVCSASNKQVRVAGVVSHQASYRRRCSRRRHRAQTRCRHRRRSKKGTAPGVAARSSAGPRHPASDRPTPLPDGLQSWDWGREGRPEGRTAATPPDQTLHSLWADRGRKTSISKP